MGNYHPTSCDVMCNFEAVNAQSVFTVSMNRYSILDIKLFIINDSHHHYQLLEFG